uniref:SUN domain-containing protein n=1 Tax=Eucampia antarctica TaxID=49252 RepID=A0A7S2SH16_9STRA
MNILHYTVLIINTNTSSAAMILLSCPSKGTSASASSVLNRNSKLYGPMNALDLKSGISNCWNSDAVVAPNGGSKNNNSVDGNDEGTSIDFIIDFHRTVCVEEIRIQFQGGFVGKDCILYVPNNNNDEKEEKWLELEEAIVEPEDTTEVQCFDLTEESETNRRHCPTLKLKFDDSSDFYGRVTIYKIEVWGTEE